MSFHKAQDRPRILIVGGGYVGFTVDQENPEGYQTDRWRGNHRRA